MVAAVAVMMTMGAAPAMACYSPCAPAPVYVAPAPVYSGCYTGCGGWARERLPDPVHQYYYVNQGPTYSGPGNWAPRPVYQETSVSYGRPYYDSYRARPHYGYRYSAGPSVRYGYAPRHGYMPRHSMRHHGAMMHRHHGHHHGHRSHVLRRYY
jgi:hypothetical protein